MKIKKNWGGGGVGLAGGGGGGGGQGSEVFMKIQTKNIVGGSVRGEGFRVGWGGGVRVDVKEELKFL